MKILFITHYSFLLGSNRSLDSLITFFRQEGIDVSVLLPSKGLFYKHLIKKNIVVHSFKFFYEVMYIKKNWKYLTLPFLWIYNIAVFPLLLLKIWKISPDIMYSNSSVDLFSVFIARMLKIKHVMHVREFMQEDFGGYCILGKNVKRRIVLKSDKIVFVSKAVAKAVVDDIPPYGKVIYNGLPVPCHQQCFTLQNENVRIGVVGNIDISKQQDLAIKMLPNLLQKFPHLTLHLIGDKKCPYKAYLKKLVTDLGLGENVIFEGFIKDVEVIYSKFDVLLMCSRSEAFGRVTIEAMLRCKPVIGYDVGGTSELIEDRVTGFKFKTCDDVIAALNIIINERYLTKKIVENAKEEALRKFAEPTYTKKVYDFIMKEAWRT